MPHAPLSSSLFHRSALVALVSAAAQEPDEAQCLSPVPIETATLAELCGSPVEILDERSEWGESIAQPDGTVVLSAALEPVRARDESGAWAPIDTTLEVGQAGLVRPVNAVSDLVFSGGGTAPLASLNSSRPVIA